MYLNSKKIRPCVDRKADMTGRNKVSVTHVVRQFFPSIGGLEDVVLNLAIGMQKQGVCTRVVTLNSNFQSGERLPRQDVVDGIPVTRLPWRGPQRYPIAPSVLRALHEPDIVHVHGIDFFFDYLAATKPLHRHALVASTHGGFFHTANHKFLKKLWFPIVTRATASMYDAVIAVSAQDHQLFSRIAGTKLSLIENGVRLDKLKCAKVSRRDPRKILAYGRLARHKQFDKIVVLLSQLLRTGPGWNLVIAGPDDGHELKYIREAITACGMQDAVRLQISPTDQELADEAASATWFCSASAYEGFGIAAVEAAAAGLIPILSEIPPFIRLRQALGVGVLFDPDRPQAAVETITRMEGEQLSEPGQIAAAVGRAVQRYGWEAATERHLELYDEVLTSRR
jgi:alpha-1,3-mannosyltransferase